jgi:broad specificity phosphatase PhoE
MSRLTSVIIGLEQEIVPTLVVSHVSILQCLMAYFRNTRVERCMSIAVPLHTVIKFTPVRGGGWSESSHPFYDVPKEVLDQTMSNATAATLTWEDSSRSMNTIGSDSSTPVWADHCLHSNNPQKGKSVV